MQLNRDSLGSGLQSEINITPLVDVVLVLLIIFMVVVPLLMQGYDVDIAQTSSEPVPAQAEVVQVVLAIGTSTCPMFEPPPGLGLPADCRVALAGQVIPVTDLPARVAEILGGRPKEQRVLFLAVDDRVNYEGVLRIVDLAKSSVDDLSIEWVAAD
jgi:biopolymer transport protein TolR